MNAFLLGAVLLCGLWISSAHASSVAFVCRIMGREITFVADKEKMDTRQDSVGTMIDSSGTNAVMVFSGAPLVVTFVQMTPGKTPTVISVFLPSGKAAYSRHTLDQRVIFEQKYSGPSFTVSQDAGGSCDLRLP